MNPIEAVTSVFRNFVNFNGRARRSEFWWFALFAFLSQIILNFVPILGSIYSLALLLPSLAVTARRLHDTNRTAWWMLLYLVPILGIIVLAIMALAVLGVNAFDPFETSEVGWGVLGVLFLIWLLISLVSWIVLLVFQIMPGTVGPNRYGPDPLRPDPGPNRTGSGWLDRPLTTLRHRLRSGVQQWAVRHRQRRHQAPNPASAASAPSAGHRCSPKPFSAPSVEPRPDTSVPGGRHRPNPTLPAGSPV